MGLLKSTPTFERALAQGGMCQAPRVRREVSIWWERLLLSLPPMGPNPLCTPSTEFCPLLSSPTPENTNRRLVLEECQPTVHLALRPSAGDPSSLGAADVAYGTIPSTGAGLLRIRSLVTSECGLLSVGLPGLTPAM